MTEHKKIIEIFGNKVRVRVCGIYVKNNELLMVKHRHIGKGEYLWAPPGGGLNFGEKVEDCLKREFKEETGLEILVSDFLFVNEFLDPPLHSIELFFLVKILGGELKKGEDPELSFQNQMIEEVRFCSDDFIKKEDKLNIHSVITLAKSVSLLTTFRGYIRANVS